MINEKSLTHLIINISGGNQQKSDLDLIGIILLVFGILFSGSLISYIESSRKLSGIREDLFRLNYNLIFGFKVGIAIFCIFYIILGVTRSKK